MRATPSFRFFAPTVVGRLVGLLSALTLFLFRVSCSKSRFIRSKRFPELLKNLC
jgi:hypothetical protein